MKRNFNPGFWQEVLTREILPCLLCNFSPSVPLFPRRCTHAMVPCEGWPRLPAFREVHALIAAIARNEGVVDSLQFAGQSAPASPCCPRCRAMGARGPPLGRGAQPPSRTASAPGSRSSMRPARKTNISPGHCVLFFTGRYLFTGLAHDRSDVAVALRADPDPVGRALRLLSSAVAGSFPIAPPIFRSRWIPGDGDFQVWRRIRPQP